MHLLQENALFYIKWAVSVIKPLYCYLQMYFWSYTWKIRTDKVACESACIFIRTSRIPLFVFRLTVLVEDCRGLCRIALVYLVFGLSRLAKG